MNEWDKVVEIGAKELAGPSWDNIDEDVRKDYAVDVDIVLRALRSAGYAIIPRANPSPGICAAFKEKLECALDGEEWKAKNVIQFTWEGVVAAGEVKPDA